MIRRIKSEVMKELPQIMRQKVIIKANAEELNQIKNLLNSVSTQDLDQLLESMTKQKFGEQEEITESAAAQNLVTVWKLFNRLYYLTAKSKIKGIKEYLKEILQNNCKFLIFAHHREILNEIETELVANKIIYMRIDGRTQMIKRQQNINEFQANDSMRVGLLSLTASSEGITLTAASNIIFAEMH
eukprot:TRINITY_DN8293_c0_g1_i4.p2 TRINITY_DN8293_c0_g1~~TRINITY_DN8293_c0_g1_i4.p2  ORF type:complete len:186 (-),score=44.90 TRINITY_DN8293_c0_g1_i4:542-1099(-)